MSSPIAALSIRDIAETSYELIAQDRGPRVLKINRRSVVLIEDRDRWLRSLARETATL
jgi:hypothetical protein